MLDRSTQSQICIYIIAQDFCIAGPEVLFATLHDAVVYCKTVGAAEARLFVHELAETQDDRLPLLLEGDCL